MLKGITTIELTDVTTGKVQKFVHENMVTNAVSDMCRSSGLLNIPINAPAYRVYDTIAENMFGGILLWENPLDLSSADDYFIPSDNKCIGYGCQLANGTINNKMGTLNESESGRMEHGYRFVWDFATHQGNGQISAVSLVPRIAGQLGLGLSPDKYDSALNIATSNFMYDYSSNFEMCNPYLFAKDNVLYGVEANNLYYNSNAQSNHISRNGKKLILRRIRCPMDKIHLMDKPLSYMTALSNIEVQLPDSFNIPTATTYYGFCNYDSGFIYLCLGTSYKGTTIATQVCKINTEDWTCSIIDVNATFDTSISYFTSFSNSVHNGSDIMKKAQVRNNKLVIAGQPCHIIDFSAPTIAQKVVYEDATDTYSYLMSLYAKVGNYLYCVASDNVVCMLNLETNRASCLNAINTSFRAITSTTSDYYEQTCVYQFPHFDEKYLFSICTRTTSGTFVQLTTVVPPHVMTTKNNLDVAVTKTSGQTMKVTYVLTEV